MSPCSIGSSRDSAEDSKAAAALARRTGAVRAATLMRADHYGWFDRPAHGLYALSPKGLAALATHAGALPGLVPA